MNIKLDAQILNEEEKRIVEAIRKLHEQGIEEAAVDDPKHFKKLFPEGISIEEYNGIVPKLVQKGFIDSRYSSPREGPLLRLTKAAENYLK